MRFTKVKRPEEEVRLGRAEGVRLKPTRRTLRRRSRIRRRQTWRSRKTSRRRRKKPRRCLPTCPTKRSWRFMVSSSRPRWEIATHPNPTSSIPKDVPSGTLGTDSKASLPKTP